jgi:hypothetical protein
MIVEWNVVDRVRSGGGLQERLVAVRHQMGHCGVIAIVR